MNAAGERRVSVEPESFKVQFSKGMVSFSFIDRISYSRPQQFEFSLILKCIHLHLVYVVPGTPGWDEEQGVMQGLRDDAMLDVSEEDFNTIYDPVFSKRGLRASLIKQYTGGDWNKLDLLGRKEVLSLCNIFIRELGWLAMPDVSNWASDALRRQVSFHEPRKFRGEHFAVVGAVADL